MLFTKFSGDINKWSPADIYFASKVAEKKIQQVVSKPPQGFNFINLNQLVNSLIDSGDLLGVSLKKAPDKVDIYRINFTQKENQDLLENQAKLIYLAVGSNLGNKIHNIEKKIHSFEEKIKQRDEEGAAQ